MSEMRVIDRTGDTKIIWDAYEKAEVKVARDTFNKLTKEGYTAFMVKRDGEPGKVLKRFDPDAEKIILSPALAGG